MTTLLFADHDNSTLSEATARALSAALEIGQDVDLLVAGENCKNVADEAAKLAGVGKVLLADAPEFNELLAEPCADLILSIAEPYDTIVAPTTSVGRSVLPRVAALLDVMQISDVINVVSEDTFDRPIYAGNAIQTVQSGDHKKVLTVRTAEFNAAQATDNQAPIENISWGELATPSRFVENRYSESDRPDIASAKLVVSGGRGFGSAENFERLITPVADRLGAAIGASRGAVDAGFAPNEVQVGQTGKIVAPELYLACAISGAIQHLAGMKGSRVIVAINKDEEAPIFQIADYGLVADVFEALPELEAALSD